MSHPLDFLGKTFPEPWHRSPRDEGESHSPFKHSHYEDLLLAAFSNPDINVNSAAIALTSWWVRLKSVNTQFKDEAAICTQCPLGKGLSPWLQDHVDQLKSWKIMATREAKWLIAVCHKGRSSKLWMSLGAVEFSCWHFTSWAGMSKSSTSFSVFLPHIYLLSDCPVETALLI